MGRLTDNILAMLGVKPSDRIVLTYEPVGNDNKQDQTTTSNTKDDQSTSGLQQQQQQTDTDTMVQHDLDTAGDRGLVPVTRTPSIWGTSDKSTEEDKECLSCRVVVSGIMFGSAYYVMKKTNEQIHTFTGWRRKGFRLQGLLLASGMAMIGVGRAFNLGIFNPSNKNVPRVELVKDDARQFLGLIGVEAPGFLQPVTIEKENGTP